MGKKTIEKEFEKKTESVHASKNKPGYGSGMLEKNIDGICTPMFIAVLTTIAKSRSHPSVH